MRTNSTLDKPLLIPARDLFHSSKLKQLYPTDAPYSLHPSHHAPKIHTAHHKNAIDCLLSDFSKDLFISQFNI